MVTTTTSPLCARLVPLMMGPDPEPVEKPPPWSQTITGRFVPPLRAGVNTFSTRQSSLSIGEPGRAFPPAAVCGAVGP